MRRVLSLIIFSLPFLACQDPCDDSAASLGVELPADLTIGDLQPLSCCDRTAAEECDSHPYGRAPYCGGIEEPQTVEACESLTERNPGLCATEYIACREAIRVAACDVCPPECAGIVGAC